MELIDSYGRCTHFILHRQLSQAIKADTSTLLLDIEEIKAQLATILENLPTPQLQIEGGTLDRDLDGGTYILKQYLDTLTDYADTVCGDLPSTEANFWDEETVFFENTVGRPFEVPLQQCRDWKVRIWPLVYHSTY
ncbi:hypothetical protein IMZ48_04225 [Candidatus Bathyarchaeota archaeon]|nr:hypothetical protein [Candidatus Bathyarchaeota archaeon]